MHGHLHGTDDARDARQPTGGPPPRPRRSCFELGSLIPERRSRTHCDRSSRPCPSAPEQYERALQDSSTKSKQKVKPLILPPSDRVLDLRGPPAHVCLDLPVSHWVSQPGQTSEPAQCLVPLCPPSQGSGAGTRTPGSLLQPRLDPAPCHPLWVSILMKPPARLCVTPGRLSPPLPRLPRPRPLQHLSPAPELLLTQGPGHT